MQGLARAGTDAACQQQHADGGEKSSCGTSHL